MNEIIGIIVASVICWLNFVIIDTYFGLPQQPGVKGVQTVGDSIEKRNGDIAGGFFQGNILCSPDASAGTLIASIVCRSRLCRNYRFFNYNCYIVCMFICRFDS